MGNKPTPAGRVPRSTWVWVGLLLLAVGLFLFACSEFWPRTVDDAYITYRYARNLVDGYGPVFNPGERVEGYTNPSWMLMLALAIAVGADPVLASKLLGVAAGLGLLWLTGYEARRAGISDWGAGATVLLVGSSGILQLWTIAGLETVAFTLLLFGGLSRLARAEIGDGWMVSSWLALAALTRPEGLLFWGLGAAAFMTLPACAPTRADRLRALAARAAAYLLPGVVLPIFLVWRRSFYGDWLPNTYYVKTGGGSRMWWQGLGELRQFLQKPEQGILMLLALAGLVVGCLVPRHRRRVAVLGGSAGIFLLYLVSIGGGDGLIVHRFFVPLVPLLALLGSLTFVTPGPRNRTRIARTVAASLIAVVVFFGVWRIRSLYMPVIERRLLPYAEGNEKFGRFLAESRPPDTWIAVAAAGAIPYYSGLPTIDMYGLNDATISRRSFPPGNPSGRMAKWDNGYVLSRRPELIVINRGYFLPGDPRVAQVSRDIWMLAGHPMDVDLFLRVYRSGAYDLVPLELPDGSTFFVFERNY